MFQNVIADFLVVIRIFFQQIVQNYLNLKVNRSILKSYKLELDEFIDNIFKIYITNNPNNYHISV